VKLCEASRAIDATRAEPDVHRPPKDKEASPAGGLRDSKSPIPPKKNGLITGQSFRQNTVQARAIKCLPCVFAFTVLNRQQPSIELLPSNDKAGVQFLDSPGLREATCCHQNRSLYFRALAGAKSVLAPGEHRVGWQPAIRNKQSSPHQMRLCMRPSVPKRVIIRRPSCRTFSGQQLRQLGDVHRPPNRVMGCPD
jgi:hypothetical protein